MATHSIFNNVSFARIINLFTKHKIYSALAFLFGILITGPDDVIAQATGEYRSKSNGPWNSSSTWERYDGVSWQNAITFPTASDETITILNGHAVNMNSLTVDQLYVQAGGTLTINGSVTLQDGVGIDLNVDGNLSIVQSTINGSGSIGVNGTMNMQDAALLCSSVMSSNSIINFNSISGSNSVYAPMNIDGIANWNSSDINVVSTITNNNSFNNLSNGSMLAGGNFINNGTFTKSSGTGVTSFSINFTNNGTFNLNSGTLRNNSVFNNNLSFVFSPGTTLDNRGTFQHNVGGQLSGSGTFMQNNGILYLNTPLNISATITFSNSGQIDGPEDITINQDMIIDNDIKGSGGITINGNINWTYGSLHRPVTVNSGQTCTINITGGGSVTKLFINNGTINWTGGNGIAFIAGITNNGIFNSFNDQILYSNVFNNNGIFNKYNSNTLPLSGQFNNVGTFELIDGAIKNNGILANSGALNFVPGTTLLNMGIVRHNLGGQFNGSGTFINSNASLDIKASLNFPNSIIYSNSGIITGNSDLIINQDFILDHDINLNNTGTLTLNGNCSWILGNIFGSVIISAGTIFTANVQAGGATKAAFTNNGTFNWVGGVDLNFHQGIVNNGEFNASALSNINGNFFTNNGTFNKSNSSGNINSVVYTNSGSFKVAASNVVCNGTIFTNDPTGIIKGNGKLTVNGNYTNNGTIEPGNSPGLLNIDIVQPLSGNSILNIEIQNLSAPAGIGYDQLQRTGNLILNGRLTVTDIGIVQAGDYPVIVSSGNITGTFSSIDLPQGDSIFYDGDTVIIRKYPLFSFYNDHDNDGFGNPNDSIQDYWQPQGYLTDKSDCNDTNFNVNPSRIELCNEIDDNCDGTIDEGCPIALNIRFYIEGFYRGQGSMIAVVDPVGYPSLCDTAWIELRAGISPYNVIYTSTGTVDVNGIISFVLPPSIYGTTYYLTLHHRNSIETWSAMPLFLKYGVNVYDFSTAASKAYGNNLKDLGDGNFAIFSGDISDATLGVGFQDGVIESQDYSDMEGALYFTLLGYRVEDITGDGVVESDDYGLMENNVYFTRVVVKP